MLGAGDTAPAGDALRILEPVLESPDEILAGLRRGALEQLRPRRLSGELQVPLPPGLEIVIGRQPSGEGRELSPQLARNLGLRRGLGTRGRRARFRGALRAAGVARSGCTRLRPRPRFLLRMSAQGGLLKVTHPGGRAPPGCGIPPRYQAAFLVCTAFEAISLPSCVILLWTSVVKLANSSVRARIFSTNCVVSSVCWLSSSVGLVAWNAACTSARPVSRTSPAKAYCSRAKRSTALKPSCCALRSGAKDSRAAAIIVLGSKVLSLMVVSDAFDPDPSTPSILPMFVCIAR